MVRPERRTRGDLVAVALIVVAVLLGGVLVWITSDARATRSEVAERPPPAPTSPAGVPPTLSEAWRAPSPSTPRPVVAGPSAVTGSGDEVVGRDPATGERRWSYARDLPLCTVGAEWGRAVAVHRKSHNCSEVTSLEGSTGKRGPQRNSDVDLGTQLLSDGRYVTASGRQVIESWRSDLVRTQQFGVPAAPKNPDNNLKRPECRHSSVAVGHGRVGLVESCPRESGERLTVIKAHPSSDEKPEEVFSVGVGSPESGAVAVNEQRAAAVSRETGQLQVYDDTGKNLGEFPVRTGAPAFRGSTANEATARGPQKYWFTGVDTVALDPDGLYPRWTVPDTLGPGAIFGGRLVVPVREGLAVHDPNTGARERVIPIDRQGYVGPVHLSSVGDVLLEQRGNTLVALR